MSARRAPGGRGGARGHQPLSPAARRRMRLAGFLRKEALQIRRDPSSLALAILLPLALLFLFGYGVSLDPQDVPIAVVLQDRGPEARELFARLEGSPYFLAREVGDLDRARELVSTKEVAGIVMVQPDFSRALRAGGAAPVGVLVDGVDANRARLVEGYVDGVLGAWTEARAARLAAPPPAGVVPVPRILFNPTRNSRHMLVPGLIALVMTLSGTLLTALVVAREWERGTMEALLATPLRTNEFMLGKLVPYFGLGMVGLFLSVGLGLLLFGVPFRGSWSALLGMASLFLLAALGIGLVISSSLRSQFVAAQLAQVLGFLPAFFFSGILFDVASMPVALQAFSRIVPARYFVSATHTLFLAGDLPGVLVPDAIALAVMAAVLLVVARARMGRGLEHR